MCDIVTTRMRTACVWLANSSTQVDTTQSYPNQEDVQSVQEPVTISAKNAVPREKMYWRSESVTPYGNQLRCTCDSDGRMPCRFDYFTEDELGDEKVAGALHRPLDGAEIEWI